MARDVALQAPTQQNKNLSDDNFMDDMMESMMFSVMIIMMSVILSQHITTTTTTSTTATSVQAQSYLGAIDTRVITADAITRWINLIGAPPYNAWIAADFTNDGPDKVYIGINTAGPWTELNNGESASISLAGANKRMETVFYRCDAGETASVRVIGKY